MQQQTKTLFIIAGVIVLVLIGYVWYSSTKVPSSALPKTDTATKTTTEVKPRSDVTVKQAEVSDIGSSFKLPAGFPATIPVEQKSITESYSAYYQTHKATQYTISYGSFKTVAEKWDEYNNFMTQNGYTIPKETSIKSKGLISGTKGKENLSVVIITQNQKTVVHLTLLKQD